MLQERLLSYERLEDRDSRRDVSHSKPTWNLFRRVHSRWRWYTCSLLVRFLSFCVFSSCLHFFLSQFLVSGETESFGSNNLMGQWLKSVGGYSVEQTDYYPSGMTAFAIASTLIASTWTDATRSRARWPVLVYMCVAVLVSSVVLLVAQRGTAKEGGEGWTGGKRRLAFFAWYFAGASYAGQATTFAWVFCSVSFRECFG